jgi:hypothetical protein
MRSTFNDDLGSINTCGRITSKTSFTEKGFSPARLSPTITSQEYLTTSWLLRSTTYFFPSSKYQFIDSFSQATLQYSRCTHDRRRRWPWHGVNYVYLGTAVMFEIPKYPTCSKRQKEVHKSQRHQSKSIYERLLTTQTLKEDTTQNALEITLQSTNKIL